MSRRTRGGLSPAASVFLAILAGLVVAALIMDWMLVDVRTTGEDGHGTRVWLPVPMAALRLAAAMVPENSSPNQGLPPEVREQLPAVREVLRTLARCPDGSLVQITSPEGNVEVALEKRSLRVDVQSPETTVHAAVPLRRLAGVLDHWDGERVDKDLVRALLGVLDDGFQLAVDAPDARVRISVR